MAKTYVFTKRDKNRYKKVYNFIKRKPIDQYCSDGDFKLIVGEVDFNNSSGPVIYTFPPTVIYKAIPVVTAISHDSENNDSANVNVFITSLTTSAVSFSSSAPFTGKVHFHIYSQD